MFDKTFNLTTLNGANGFVIEGLAAGDSLGRSVSTAGDLNGDGKADLVVGAYWASPGNRTQAGTAYVILGQDSGWPSKFDLNTLNGTNGFVVNGRVSGDWLGYSVSTAGDINGDGKTDLVLGADRVASFTGATYVIFGQSSFTSLFNLGSLNGANGFVVNGIAYNDNLGCSVSTAGDINGDGKTDLVLGAYGVSSPYFGAAYVIFGQSSFTSPFNLGSLNGTRGFVVNGIASGGWLGYSVSIAGDINGDGKTDLVLGANGVANFTGATYVIFGQSSFTSPFNLGSLNGANGFVVNGITSNDNLGFSVNTAGDINGDGKTDLVLGAWGVSSNAGAVYVIFGQSSFTSPFNLGSLNGANGFVVNGIASGGRLGSVSTAGDINGDGKTDLVLGAPRLSSNTGAAYVIFGQSSFTSPFNLDSLNGVNGFAVNGIANGNTLGWSVSTAGDINEDGIDDVLLGAPDAFQGGGTAYVIFGKFPLRSGNNTITIKQARSVILTSNNLSAIDLNGSSQALRFNITSVQGGQFEWRNTSQPVTVFEQQAIYEGQIQFVQNGSPDGVAYQVNVTNGAVHLPTQTANVTFILTEPFVYRPFPNQTVPLNQPFNWTVPIDTFMSRDNQPLAYSLEQTNGSALPNWLQFESMSRQIYGRAPLTGAYSFSLAAEDPYQLSAHTDFNLLIIHNPPVVLNSPLSQRVEVNQPFEFTFEADQIFNSTDGDPLTFSAQSNDGSPLPKWVHFNVQDVTHLTFTGRPLTVGDSGLALLAKNPWNQSAQANFSLSAISPNVPEPTIGVVESIGAVVGGILGFGALIGLGYGIYQKVASRGYTPINNADDSSKAQTLPPPPYTPS